MSLLYPPSRLFVPEYTSDLMVHISGCITEGVDTTECPLLLTLGSATLRKSSDKTANCTGRVVCTIMLHNPPWETWVRVTVESTYINLTTAFTISANLTGECIITSWFHLMIKMYCWPINCNLMFDWSDDWSQMFAFPQLHLMYDVCSSKNDRYCNCCAAYTLIQAGMQWLVNLGVSSF